jgi:hypothetical protein
MCTQVIAASDMPGRPLLRGAEAQYRRRAGHLSRAWAKWSVDTGLAGYGRHDGTVGGYAKVPASYAVGMGGAALALRLAGRRLPSLRLNDLLLFGVATYHVAHIAAKDPVTSPLRAPFTRFEGVAGPAELRESVPGRGIKKSIGELVKRRFCLGQWVASGFTLGAVAAPRLSRFAAGVCAVAALSDGLQLVRNRLQQ